MRRVLLAGCAAVVALALSIPASAPAAPVPLAQVGSAGTGAGQLTSPSGVALDGAGNLYVADTGNRRISVFSPNGTFIHAFGWGVDSGGGAFEVCTTATMCQAGVPGGGGGQLNTPSLLTLDGVGNLYVADTSNHRISVFNTAGPSFTHAFGWDVAEPNGTLAFEVCPTDGACRPGDAGGGGGQLNLPFGVAHDGAGSLYVTDQLNHRIDVFGTAGPTFTRAFGWDVAEPDGNMAFEVCPTDGACRAGDAGGGGGQFNTPDGVALDGAGSLYVADFSNFRMQVFGTAGPSFTHAFGWDVADPNGDLAFEVCPIQGACQGGDSGAGIGQFDEPQGVDTDCRGAVWVADAVNNRLQRFGEPGTPLPPCPAANVVPPVLTPAAVPSTLTGQRAAALKKCKRKPKGPKRKKCIKKAKKLPA